MGAVCLMMVMMMKMMLMLMMMMVMITVTVTMTTRREEEGRREEERRGGVDAGRCLFKTRTQHHRMVGKNGLGMGLRGLGVGDWNKSSPRRSGSLLLALESSCGCECDSGRRKLSTQMPRVLKWARPEG